MYYFRHLSLIFYFLFLVVQPEDGVRQAGAGEDRDAAPLCHGEHFLN